MPDQNEPKSTEEMVNDLLNGGEQQQESSPAPEQPEVATGSTGEVHKTQDQQQKPETDKGFASHPAWVEREAKLKETRELLERERANSERYSKLLDELQKRQSSQSPSKEQQAQSIAEKACKKLGWDINRLDAQQRAHIQDLVDLNVAVMGDYVKEQLDQRLGPMEQARQRWEAEQALKAAESKWASLASEDKLDVKVVQEAINKFCQELDAKDPQQTQKFSDEDLYFRATRPLLRERDQSQVRQEARGAVKANARPLGNGTASQSTPTPNPHKINSREWIEAELAARGIR